MNANAKECPDPQLLSDFLLGKLDSDENESCEVHISECHPCIETIRGLKSDGDTLNELAREAWKAAAESSGEIDDQQAVEGLIARMQNLTGPVTGGTMPHIAGRAKGDDRAAEVDRLLSEPRAEGDIGALAHYRVMRLLGAGSTGVVYHAVDEKLDRTVALKVLRPSLGEAARERFTAEARATALLSHPNIVQIFEVGNEGPLAYMAMQWLPGQTLEDLLESKETLSSEATKKLGLQLANGLAHAQQRGLIHRDIKPANIWMAEDNSPRILDFGLVRIADESAQLTCTGMIAGTPCYMSPEQSRGQRLDGRSDLFSLGCVMYQALSGQLPFCSDNALSTLQSIQRDQPTPPFELDPSVDKDISDLVMCLLEKSPGRRPPDAESVSIALNSKRADWPFDVHALAAPVKPEVAIAGGHGRGWWTAIVCTFLGLALGALGMMYGDHITRIVTNQGEIEIKTNVDDVKIEVIGNDGDVRIVDLATEQALDIKAGSYEIRPMGDLNSVTIEPNQLTMTRGGRKIVTVKMIESSRGGANTAGITTPGSSPAPALPAALRKIQSEDVLGIFVEGVLGQFDSSPPVHFPPAGMNLPPSMGFPVLVDHDGNIHLPLIEPVMVRGLTLQDAESLVKSKYIDGTEDTILLPQGRILVTMMSMAELRDSSSVEWSRRPMEQGDVVGVFVEGVLGEFDKNPPVQVPTPGSGIPPSMGFPIVVRSDGNLHLPLIEPVYVLGLNSREVLSKIREAYTRGPEPILRDEARILVSLMQPVDGNNYASLPYSDLMDLFNRSGLELQELVNRHGKAHPEVQLKKLELDRISDRIRKLAPEFIVGGDVDEPWEPWDPGETVELALLGHFDIDGDGQSDNEMMQQLVVASGGKVVAYIDNGGNVVGGVTAQTRYGVLGNVTFVGGLEFANGSMLTLLNQCNEHSVEAISLAKFMGRIGYAEGDLSAYDTSTNDTSTNDTSTNDTSTNDTPANDTPANEGADYHDEVNAIASGEHYFGVDLNPDEELEATRERFASEEISLTELLRVEEAYIRNRLQLSGNQQDYHQQQIQLVEILERQFDNFSKLAEESATSAETETTGEDVVEAPIVQAGHGATTNVDFDFERNACRSFLMEARLNLRNYEKEKNLPCSQPVYNGRTFEEWMEVARTEYDWEQLKTAGKALDALARETEADEVLDVFVSMFRRRPSSDDRQRLQEVTLPRFRRATHRKRAELLLRELKEGDETSCQESLARYQEAWYTNAFDFNDEMAQKVIAALCNRANEEPVGAGSFAHRALIQAARNEISKRGTESNSIDFKKHAEAIKYFQNKFAQTPSSSFGVYDQVLVKYAPETPGLYEKFSNTLTSFSSDTADRLEFDWSIQGYGTGDIGRGGLSGGRSEGWSSGGGGAGGMMGDDGGVGGGDEGEDSPGKLSPGDQTLLVNNILYIARDFPKEQVDGLITITLELWKKRPELGIGSQVFALLDQSWDAQKDAERVQILASLRNNQEWMEKAEEPHEVFQMRPGGVTGSAVGSGHRRGGNGHSSGDGASRGGAIGLGGGGASAGGSMMAVPIVEKLKDRLDIEIEELMNRIYEPGN